MPKIVAEARRFIPPEFRRPDITSDQVLIRPLSPPDIKPKQVQLPSMRIWTSDLPKITKRFVAPGRKAPPPPEQVHIVPPPPDFNFVHADPVPSTTQARLTLPMTPPPMIDARPQKVETPAAPAVPAGDPVNVISMNSRNVPLEEKLVIPPGNLFGKSGDAGPGASAAATDKASNAAGSKTGNATAPSTPVTSPSASSTSASLASSGTSSTAPAGPPSKVASAGPGVANGNPASGSSTSSASAPVTIAGSSSGNGVPGGVKGGRGQVIVRPADGRFDAMVVQSAPLDQFPEGKTLLTGRPIYSVYIALGTPKDWAMYFCIPNEKPKTDTSGYVVQLGTSTPVQAPYPTRMLRPDVTIPSYYKYVLVHGLINEGGHFENLRVVRTINPEADRDVLASLGDWQFRAATKDGVKIAVEFLLSIPVAGM
jgi:hypothetical protein